MNIQGWSTPTVPSHRGSVVPFPHEVSRIPRHFGLFVLLTRRPLSSTVLLVLGTPPLRRPSSEMRVIRQGCGCISSSSRRRSATPPREIIMFRPPLLLLLLLLACASTTRHGAGAFVTLTSSATSLAGACGGRVSARGGRGIVVVGGGSGVVSAPTSTSTSPHAAAFPPGCRTRRPTRRRRCPAAPLSMSSSGLEKKWAPTPPGQSTEEDVEALPELNHDEVRRYSRHLILPDVGVSGQRRLKASSVLAVGTGGLGSPALLYLAAAGVGRLGIVDDDVVDESNLQRQARHAAVGCGWGRVYSREG